MKFFGKKYHFLLISYINLLNFRNHKLNTVCAYLNINLSHHNAKSDSFGCLMILIKAMEAYGCFEVDDFVSKVGINYKYNM